MLLNKFVKARQEGSHYFLHHAINGGLLKMESRLFQFLADDNLAALPCALQTKLKEMEFLKPYDRPAVKTNYQEGKRVKRTGFISLRSHKAPFHAFWEITAKCTLTCLYCFPDMKSKRTVRAHKEMSSADLHRICDQIIEAGLFKVTLTGGEALLRDDVWEIIKKLEDNAIMVSIISNGVYFPDEFMEKISHTNALLAISLDAPNETCNRITRGPNAFEKTLNTIRKLRDNKIRTSSIITLTQHNFQYLEQTVELLRDNGIMYITLQDLKPFGSKEIYDAARLTPVQEAGLPEKIACLEWKYPDIGFMFTELFMFCEGGRAGNGKLMDCPAGEHFGYIDYQGNFYPCNVLRSFNMGNLLERPLIDLWRNSPEMHRLRQLKELPLTAVEKCAACRRKNVCHGGCRGDALFYDGHLMGVPSRCPERGREAVESAN